MNEAQKIRGRIIKRAWEDPAFKERLRREPKAVCREYGLDIPDDVSLELLEPSVDSSLVFVIPKDKPPVEDVRRMDSQEVLHNFDARLGYGFGCCGFEAEHGIRKLKAAGKLGPARADETPDAPRAASEP